MPTSRKKPKTLGEILRGLVALGAGFAAGRAASTPVPVCRSCFLGDPKLCDGSQLFYAPPSHVAAVKCAGCKKRLSVGIDTVYWMSEDDLKAKT